MTDCLNHLVVIIFVIFVVVVLAVVLVVIVENDKAWRGQGTSVFLAWWHRQDSGTLIEILPGFEFKDVTLKSKKSSVSTPSSVRCAHTASVAIVVTNDEEERRMNLSRWCELAKKSLSMIASSVSAHLGCVVTRNEVSTGTPGGSFKFLVRGRFSGPCIHVSGTQRIKILL